MNSNEKGFNYKVFYLIEIYKHWYSEDLFKYYNFVQIIPPSKIV